MSAVAATVERSFTLTRTVKNNNNTSHKQRGVSSEVYAFQTEEELWAMIERFNEKIAEARSEEQKRIQSRNKLLFLIGINVGLRCSDLVSLKWSFFFDENMKLRQGYSLAPKKTKNKIVKLRFNAAIEKAIMEYIEKYPIRDLNDYVFESRKGEHLLERCVCRIIKEAAQDVGIERNIGSHSLRKTFGFWCWHNAQDSDKALVILQKIFNHSSTQTTLQYIGVLQQEMDGMYENLDLGIDFI